MSKQKNKGRKKRMSNPVLPNHRVWKCSECQWILGYSNPDKTELRIKFKDLYINIEGGGKVTQKCRRCGKDNSTQPEDDKS